MSHFVSYGIARDLELNHTFLSKILSGKNELSPGRAARIAKNLGVPERVFIQLALQDTLRSAKLHYDVEIKKAS